MSLAPMAITPDMVAQTRDARAAQGSAPLQSDIMLRRSSDCAAMLDYWDQTDDIVTGYKAVRDAGEKYLPRFTDEDPDEYKGRQKLTKMTNVYRDIVEGLAAKPFEREVALVGDNVPSEVSAFAEDVDGSGNNLSVFLYGVFFNGINSAIDWIYVDHPVADNTVQNMAQYKARGLRPYWSRVLGRNVLQPVSTMIDGKETLTYMRILEPGETETVRVFVRDDNGVVRWATFTKGAQWIDPDTRWLHDVPPAGSKTQFVFDKEGTISIGEIPLVPFVTGRRDGRTFRLFPSMRDAADLQIELYQQESGLKFAKTLTAYPMLAGNGITPAKGPDGQPLKIRVGPARVLYGSRDGNGQPGSWGYVEPSATSLTFLAADIKETKQDLRELGRQPLTAQSGNLTVITTAVAAGKARSAVGAWAYGLKDSAENALRMTCKFRGIAYEPELDIFTEFDDGLDDAADVAALISLREGDNPAISLETLWEELKRRKKLSAEFTADRERERLLAEVPSDKGEDTKPDDQE
jgi:hypothetical protein